LSQKPPEKRLRLRRRDEVDKGVGKINTQTCKFLQITSRMAIVVAGKKKLELTASPLSDTPENEVWVNTDEMKVQGLSDNSIATVRKA
jgi:hypothetical protein